MGRERRALLVTQNTLLILSARQLSDASASGFVCLWCLHFTTRWTDGSANDKRHANTSVEEEGNKDEEGGVGEGPARFRARSRQSIVSTWLWLAGRMCNIKSNYFLCNMVTAWGRLRGEGRAQTISIWNSILLQAAQCSNCLSCQGCQAAPGASALDAAAAALYMHVSYFFFFFLWLNHKRL